MTKIDIRIKARAQNAILARWIDGYGTQALAAARSGMTGCTSSAWLNFRSHPTDHAMEKRRTQWKRIIPILEKETGRNIREIFPSLGKDALRILSKERISDRTVETAQITSQGEREKLSYCEDVGRDIDNEHLRERLKKVVSTLSFREREIINLRYGLTDGVSYTHGEIGHSFKISSERVRQIESKALGKLALPNRSQKLVEFLDG